MKNKRKGLTYEEIFGRKKAIEIKRKKSIAISGNKHFFYGKKHKLKTKKKIAKRVSELLKGVSYIERYGKEKAKEIIEKKRKKSGKFIKDKTYEEYYGVDKAKEIKMRQSKSMKGKLYEDIMNDYKSVNNRIKKVSGKNSHFYINGNGVNYISKRIRRQVMKRDKYICQLCLNKIIKIGIGDCHHIQYYHNDKRLITMVALHHGCHTKIRFSFNKDFWFAYFCYIKNINPEVIL